MFPIAALLEVGNINLSRVELIWSPITTHLSEVREREREREIITKKVNNYLPTLLTGLFSWFPFIESFCCRGFDTAHQNITRKLLRRGTSNPSNSIPCHFNSHSNSHSRKCNWCRCVLWSQWLECLILTSGRNRWTALLMYERIWDTRVIGMWLLMFSIPDSQFQWLQSWFQLVHSPGGYQLCYQATKVRN